MERHSAYPLSLGEGDPLAGQVPRLHRCADLGAEHVDRLGEVLAGRHSGGPGSINGVITGPTTGSVAGTLPAVTGSVAGVSPVVGSISGTLPSITGGIAGGVIITGLTNASIPKVTGGTQPPVTDYTITAGTPILGSGVIAGRGIW